MDLKNGGIRPFGNLNLELSHNSLNQSLARKRFRSLYSHLDLLWVNELWDSIIVHLFNPATRKTSKRTCGIVHDIDFVWINWTIIRHEPRKVL